RYAHCGLRLAARSIAFAAGACRRQGTRAFTEAPCVPSDHFFGAGEILLTQWEAATRSSPRNPGGCGAAGPGSPRQPAPLSVADQTALGQVIGKVLGSSPVA